MSKTFIIAEIGINHNGSLDIAKQLIDGAVDAGCNMVKFQKRTLDIVYEQADLDRPRESPWGTTNRQQKQGLEFSKEEYTEIARYCTEKGIEWTASAWDLPSQLFIREFNLNYNKVASAMLTNRKLLEAIAEEKRHTFISTGMSTMEQIQKAVNIFRAADCPFELMHCCSTYPMAVEDANLRTMETLRNTFNCNVGYSGHETGLVVSCVAAALGATSLERHITLDRSMYGSDQSASVELDGLKKLVKYVRAAELSLGSPIKQVTKKEIEIAQKLRRVNTL
jgi:N-acetylneuraminate synthase